MPALLSLLLGAALAQEVPEAPVAPEGPSPVAQCAEAARGAEVEICLQLAADHPDQVDGIAAALRAHIARQGSPDQALLLALLALVDDATAVEAAGRIAAQGDPRGLPALVACAERRQPEISEACVRGVARYDAGLEPLERWLIDDAVPTRLRVTAARGLGLVGSQDAGDALVDVLRRPGLPRQLRTTILQTLERAFPDRSPDTDGQVASDGRLWLSAGGAWSLGFAMGAAGHYGQSDLAEFGVLTGVVAGGTGGWLYGRAWPMESDDAAYLTSSAVLGTTGGALLGAGLTDGSADGLYGGGLAGLAGASALSLATRRAHPGREVDALEAGFLGAAGGLTLGSVGALAEGSGSVAQPLYAGVGVLSASVVGQGLAPSIALSARDRGTIALASGWGLVAMAGVPDLEDRPALLGLGAGTGALLATLTANHHELRPDVQAGAVAGAAHGLALGAGLGLISDTPGAVWVGAVTLGTGGLVGGGLVARLDPEPLDDRDLVLGSLGSAWFLGQSLGWAAVVQPETPASTGWFVVVPTLLSGGLALATPEIDIPVSHSVAAASVGLWGAYTGGVLGELGPGEPLVGALVGSNVGLGLGALAMSPLVGAPPVVIGVADAGGAVGGSVVALAAGFATDDPRAVLGASLVGSGVGFATGAVIGASWKKGGTRDMARVPSRVPVRVMLRPDFTPDRSGLAVEVTRW